jgi:hypothetical protein
MAKPLIDRIAKRVLLAIVPELPHIGEWNRGKRPLFWYKSERPGRWLSFRHGATCWLDNWLSARAAKRLNSRLGGSFIQNWAGRIQAGDYPAD